MFCEAIKQGNVITAINDAGDKTPYLLLSSEDQKKVVRSFTKAIQRHVHRRTKCGNKGCCSICGQSISSKDIEKLGRKRAICASRFKEACFTCSASSRQAVLKKSADRAVEKIVGDMDLLSPVQWPSKIDKLQVKHDAPRLYKKLAALVGAEPNFDNWATTPLKVRLLEFADPVVSSEQLQQAMSGSLREEVEFANHRVLKAPPDGTFGLLVLKRGDHEKRMKRGKSPHNHLLVRQTAHKVEDIADRIKLEMGPLKAGAKMRRRGPASGIFMPEHPEPRQLSKCTQGRRIPVEQSTTKAYPLWYENKDTHAWHKQYVYPEMFGRKLLSVNANPPFSESIVTTLWNSPGYRKLALAEMACHFWYFAILEKYELCPVQANVESFLQGFHLNQVEFNHWRESFPEDVPTVWEYILLKYCFTMNDTINHQACSAHTDGDGDEILSLFGRPSFDMAVDDFRLLEQSVDGHLVILDTGIAIHMKANHTEIHATLDDIVHLADFTRNSKNILGAKHKP